MRKNIKTKLCIGLIAWCERYQEKRAFFKIFLKKAF